MSARLEEFPARRVLEVMLEPGTASSSLSAALDVELSGWLERRAEAGFPPRADLEASMVITVAERAVAAVERLCLLWGLRFRSTPCDGGRWAVLRIDGPALPVQGLAEITRQGW
jgi:hypothetical protein